MLKNSMLSGSPPCSPQMPTSRCGFALRPFSTAMRTSCPTPSRSSVWKGLKGRIFTLPSMPGSSSPSTYLSRNLPSASSRLKYVDDAEGKFLLKYVDGLEEPGIEGKVKIKSVDLGGRRII